jgi:predicted DNA-binding protein
MPITLPPDLEARLAALAERDGLSMDSLVAEVVRRHLEDEKIAGLDA